MKLFRSLAVVALLCAPLPALAAPVEYLNADGINKTPVSVANPLPVTGGTGGGGGASSQAAVAFRQTCTASAVQMASNTFANGAVVKALITNGGTAYIGPSGVTTSTGYPLTAGEAISYGVANSSQLYLICSDTTSVIAVTGN